MVGIFKVTFREDLNAIHEETVEGTLIANMTGAEFIGGMDGQPSTVFLHRTLPVIPGTLSQFRIFRRSSAGNWLVEQNYNAPDINHDARGITYDGNKFWTIRNRAGAGYISWIKVPTIEYAPNLFFSDAEGIWQLDTSTKAGIVWSGNGFYTADSAGNQLEFWRLPYMGLAPQIEFSVTKAVIGGVAFTGDSRLAMNHSRQHDRNKNKRSFFNGKQILHARRTAATQMILELFNINDGNVIMTHSQRYTVGDGNIDGVGDAVWDGRNWSVFYYNGTLIVEPE